MFQRCWIVARENSSNDNMPSWLVSSWSKMRRAGLSVFVPVALGVVDGVADGAALPGIAPLVPGDMAPVDAPGPALLVPDDELLPAVEGVLPLGCCI
ncbi:MAG TPA: hypothetical protein VMV45_17010 [Casimicrobiaceae bacterium]|nr:hypothetical protein [Casimicrobiaceae bacterium]